MAYIFNFAFWHVGFFYIIELAVIFLTYRNAVWFFPFGNLLKEARFQDKEWNILHTRHAEVMQTTLHKNVKCVSSEVEI